ncbi:MAG: alkaline phosphatase family protein [Bacteroidales bacterium]|nr:alkaline phosphatase family protein [Bacteroidales bacterium]
MRKIPFIFFLLCGFVFHGFAQNNSNSSLPLIVGIVVQQMRYDAIARYSATMSDNGFLRLLTKGAVCNNAYYEYMITEPAPGYATIFTGANPVNHGIIADTWYDRVSKKYVPCIQDTRYRAVGSESETGQVSPLSLLGTTLGDEMKLSNFKQSKVFCVSYNNYGAVIPAGKLGDCAYWVDEKTGGFITSSYYKNELPEWVKTFNSINFPSQYLERGWFTLKNMNEYKASLPDNSFYENGIAGKSTFPYNLKQMNTAGDYKILRYTPYANEYVKDFVLNLIENEDIGKDNFTDLVVINFSAAGYASDVFGIRSVELEDIYLRLDSDIATILTRLDQRLGRGNYIVFLTSDRGSSDTPLFLQDMGMSGKKIDVKHYMTLLNAYLRALYGDEKWVDKYFNRQVYLNRLAIERHKLSLKEVQDMASQFLLEIEGISDAVPASALLENHSLTGIWKQAVNSFNRKRSGDIIINLEPGWYEIGENTSEFSLSAQNSPYNHDTHVPLIFYGRGINKLSVSRKISTADITPTLCTILKILSPDCSSGQAVYEVVDY